MNRAFYFGFSANDRFELSCRRKSGKVCCEAFKRTGAGSTPLLAAFFRMLFGFFFRERFRFDVFITHAMGKDFQKLKSLDTQFAHKVTSIGALFVIERNNEIGYLYFFFACGLRLHDCALYDRLETSTLDRLRIANNRHFLLEISFDAVAHLLQISIAVFEDIAHLFKRKACKENMLRHEILMVPEFCFVICSVKNRLHFRAYFHAFSIIQRSGNPRCLAIAWTCCILVVAMS